MHNGEIEAARVRAAQALVSRFMALHAPEIAAAAQGVGQQAPAPQATESTVNPTAPNTELQEYLHLVLQQHAGAAQNPVGASSVNALSHDNEIYAASEHVQGTTHMSAHAEAVDASEPTHQDAAIQAWVASTATTFDATLNPLSAPQPDAQASEAVAPLAAPTQPHMQAVFDVGGNIGANPQPTFTPAPSPQADAQLVVLPASPLAAPTVSSPMPPIGTAVVQSLGALGLQLLPPAAFAAGPAPQPDVQAGAAEAPVTEPTVTPTGVGGADIIGLI